MLAPVVAPPWGSNVCERAPWLFEPEELAFNAEVREFCIDQAKDFPSDQFFRGRGSDTRELYRSLGQRGWLSLSWPPQYGGQGLGIAYDFLLWNQLANFRLARPDFGPGIIAHVLIQHGTEAQKSMFLPAIASGEVCFALGYSEPEAGSDLAGLRTRATRDGDVYRVNGEKCWTSDAHNADFLWLLCRTGDQQERARGLSLFIVDVRDVPGLTVLPIPTMDGHRVNQVLFDDVVVPASRLIGDVNAAWDIIRGALAVERHLQLLPGRPERDLGDIVTMCDELGMRSNAKVEAELVRLAVRFVQVEAAVLSTVAQLDRGKPATVEAARARLMGSRLVQDIARTAIDIGGSAVAQRPHIFEFLWRQSIMETIAGGTSEILEGVIAREGLRLGTRK